MKNLIFVLFAVFAATLAFSGCDEDGDGSASGLVKSGFIENDGLLHFEPDRQVYTIRFFEGEVRFNDLRGNLWRNQQIVKTLVPNLVFDDGILNYTSPVDISVLPQLTAGATYTALFFFSPDENDPAGQGSLMFVMPPVLKIFTFEPIIGGAGTVVNFSGVNFSPDPDSNRVFFNNVQAEVTEADAFMLTAIVPEGATTGPVSMIVGEREFTGNQFIVTLHPGPLPTLGSVLPGQAAAGDTLHLAGTGFDPVPGVNLLRFALPGLSETIVPALTATDTTLTVEVPFALALGQTYQLSVEIIDVTTNLVQFTVVSGVNLTTVAGSGTPGFLNGSLLGSRFNSPTDVHAVQADVLYVCDRLNHRIRKVDFTSGAVTTFSGSGVIGSTDGPPNLARFNSPQGIWVTPSGDVYVADTGNNKIRKIDPAGNVTTLAGTGAPGFADGPGASAQFFGPTDVAVGASGNVYVADRANQRIRKIDNSGNVSTLAGSGSAGLVDGTGSNAMFRSPTGLTVNAAGDVYVADFGNDAVRKITPGGVVTTVTGTGSPGYSDGPLSSAEFFGPIALAFDPSGSVLYVSDFWNHRIRSIDLTLGEVGTAVGNGRGGFRDDDVIFAQLSGSFGLWVDDQNRVFVADQNVHRIRAVSE